MRKLFIVFVLWVVLLTACVGRGKETQDQDSIAVEPSPTHVSITLSKVLPSPTNIPLSATELENFFGNSSCAWPCWQGVTPGITTSVEALQRLNVSPSISKNSLHSEGSEAEFGTADWQWKLDEKRLADDGKIEWHDGIVFDILLNTY
jgi:hypothetical protein